MVTCWDVGSGGETDMDVERLTRDFTIDYLVAELVERPEHSSSASALGMAETGVVVDEHGAARHRALRGSTSVGPPNSTTCHRTFATRLGTTGLALKAECSFVEIVVAASAEFTINADAAVAG